MCPGCGERGYPLDTRVELRQLFIQLGEGVSGKHGQSRLRVILKTNDGWPYLLGGWRNHQPILGQQAPNLIDDGGSVFHEERSRVAHGLQVGTGSRPSRKIFDPRSGEI